MTNAGSTIAAFHDLKPLRFAILRRFELSQTGTVPSSTGLRLALDLQPENAGLGSLHLVFEGVRDLKIDWPSWSVITTDVIEVSDISDRGMEDLYFRVSEGAGMFAFSCRAFTATVE
ncbi:MAG: hypothetical protein M3256_06970 [Actinomycetota bacterium]|nr:hypothetical protein [Actinomycetota bacterium]